MRERLAAQGEQPRNGTPGELGKFIHDETEKRGSMIRKIGLEVD